MKRYTPALVAMIGGLLLLIPIGGGDVRPADDVLGQSHAADRLSQVQILRELAETDLSDLAAARDFVNAKRIPARTTDWIPYTDAVGEAIGGGKEAVEKLANTLEKNR